MTNHDKQHLKNLTQYEQQVASLMEQTQRLIANTVWALVSDSDRSTGEPFLWDNHQMAKMRMEQMVSQLNDNIQQTIESGINLEWQLSNTKNDEVVTTALGDYLASMPEERRSKYLNNHDEARKAFLARKVNGMSLSERVWDLSAGYKEELEMGISVALQEGTSAATLSKKLCQYLKNPEALYRRVRNQYGELELSKHARAYHPGQGVYRSAYKNAMRLAGTEINIAYRTSDYDRWQDMDFVVGVEIEPSNTNHKDYDICNTLAGKYPKEFKFTGWHPNCRCHATPILKTPKEMERDRERIMRGEEPLKESGNTVAGVPEQYERWVKENQKRIEARRTLPDYLKDNKGLLIQTIERHGREASKRARLALANHTEKHNYTQAQQDNFRAIASVTGYQRGTPMTFEQADNGRSNQSKDKDNCAACVLTHELRLRGFDITALPYNSETNSISEQLALDTRRAWLTQKGDKPKYTALISGTEKEIRSKISKHTAVLGSRYHIGWDTDQDLGHIVTMERTEQGIVIYDPQKDNFLSLGEIINEMMPRSALQLLRVDTLLVNPQLLHNLATPLIE